MPITPQFFLSQTLETVSVTISVPHVRVSVSSVQVVVEDESIVHFSSSPYLLVLHLPQSVVDPENSACATYDPSSGTIVLSFQKCEPQHWKDLDLFGRLVKPSTSPYSGMAVQAVEQSEEFGESDEASGLIERKTENESDTASLSPHYGFLNLFSNVFTDLAREGLAAEMLEIPNPDQVDESQREELRLQAELKKFDDNRYLQDLDLENDYYYQAAMSYEPHWLSFEVGTEEDLTEQMSRLSTNDQGENNSSKDVQTVSYFDQEELTQLASIPYPLLPNSIDLSRQESLLMSLLDLLFAYVYDHMLTLGDPTVESSWTICILSPTLSWLQPPQELEKVVASSIRRSLIYPYLRNYNLAFKMWNHVVSILSCGRRCVLRCLLQVRAILNKSEFHYLGNKLYVDPYLAWLQQTDVDLNCVHDKLNYVLASFEGKQKLGLNLIELEESLHVCSSYGSSSESSIDEGSNDSSSESDLDSCSEDSSVSSIQATSRTSQPVTKQSMEPETNHSKELLQFEKEESHSLYLTKGLTQSGSPEKPHGERRLIEEIK